MKVSMRIVCLAASAAVVCQAFDLGFDYEGFLCEDENGDFHYYAAHEENIPCDTAHNLTINFDPNPTQDGDEFDRDGGDFGGGGFIDVGSPPPDDTEPTVPVTDPEPVATTVATVPAPVETTVATEPPQADTTAATQSDSFGDRDGPSGGGFGPVDFGGGLDFGPPPDVQAGTPVNTPCDNGGLPKSSIAGEYGLGGQGVAHDGTDCGERRMDEVETPAAARIDNPKEEKRGRNLRQRLASLKI